MGQFVPNYRKQYDNKIVAALKEQFNYSNVMQVPKLEKIVINQGIGAGVADKRMVENAVKQLSIIAGQKAVTCYSKKDVSTFKLRKNMPIGAKVTLRAEGMYEFLERLVAVALPRVRDFRGINFKFDSRGNYTLGIKEQIIFPEINIDNVDNVLGMDITFVTSANTDEEGYALLTEFGLPFKNKKH
ncbi:MAG: large subunit ribosomal protein L5 [Flavobacteriales bacterium]|jgi:large subunit ribosomal protein L5|tara:strand:- start:3258 stop:3815 length:558 start_codon:yes stop_codon:yes gene_type:complete